MFQDEILSSVRIHKEKVYIDPVTGVYNKRYYVEKLSKMDNAAALMFADIKNFKRINENFGHQAGDDVLRQVAGVLRDAAAGKGDVLRYSGDDFVTVFFKATEEELSEIQKEMCGRVEALRFPGAAWSAAEACYCRYQYTRQGRGNAGAGKNIKRKSRRAKPLGTFVFLSVVDSPNRLWNAIFTEYLFS